MSKIQLGRDYVVYREGSGNTVEIFDIEVRSERGCGRGTELIKSMLRELPSRCRLVWAITRESNTIAQAFYNRLGFRLIGVLQEFYTLSPEEAERLGKEREHGLMYGIDPALTRRESTDGRIVSVMHNLPE